MNRSLSARTLHLTSCLTDLLAKYKTKTLFNLLADGNTHTNKNNPDVIIAIDPWIHTGSTERGPAQRGRVRGVYTVDGADIFILLLPSKTLSSQHKAALIG